MVPAGLFPANWIVANPQFDGPASALAPTTGATPAHPNTTPFSSRVPCGRLMESLCKATYIFSKSMQTPLVSFAAGNGLTTAQTYTNPVDRNKDCQLSPGNATHDFKSYGTFELPIGPGKLLMGGSHGVLARVIEGWQSSFIVNLSAGQPANISASYINAQRL